MNSRTESFRRNSTLEGLLTELNSALIPAESDLLQHRGGHTHPSRPVVLVVGAPRSGSTLLMQWLAQGGGLAYPTNLLSRFYNAPGIGALIQKLLCNDDYRFAQEFQDLPTTLSTDYSSTLGKTKGALGPNEFWYFWRRFIPNVEPRQLTDPELDRIDAAGFLEEIALLESIFQRPWAMKGHILELNLAYLNKLFNSAIFIYMKRHHVYNAQSLLRAREAFYGTRDQWYSVKPPQYSRLSTLPPTRQVAGQVAFINRSLERDLASIPAPRKLEVEYEAFCRSPATTHDELSRKLKAQGAQPLGNYSGPRTFRCTNEKKLPEELFVELQTAVEEFTFNPET